MSAAVLFTLLCVGALLAADWCGSRIGVWIAKPLASSGFVAAALLGGALETSYGRCVLAALLLSWLGDVLLIPKGTTRVFRGGVASFLLGHVAFAGAFLLRATSAGTALIVALAASVAGAGALRWLRPQLPEAMRVAVYAYVVVISIMLVCAASTWGGARGPMILLGAALFYVSDLSVARDRFVAPGFINRAWGLPAYYGAQLVLASSV